MYFSFYLYWMKSTTKSTTMHEVNETVNYNELKISKSIVDNILKINDTKEGGNDVNQLINEINLNDFFDDNDWCSFKDFIESSTSNPISNSDDDDDSNKR